MDKFKDRLNQAILEKGITKAELAKRTGIGRNSISDYTNGKYEAKQDKIFLIARALDINEAWLMGLDVPKERNQTQEDYYDSLVDSIINKNPLFDEIVGKLGKLNNDELKLINNTIDNLLQIKEKRD